MSMSTIAQRRASQDAIMAEIDALIRKSKGTFDEKFALIEQRNRISKIFGRPTLGLDALGVTKPNVQPDKAEEEGQKVTG